MTWRSKTVCCSYMGIQALWKESAAYIQVGSGLFKYTHCFFRLGYRKGWNFALYWVRRRRGGRRRNKKERKVIRTWKFFSRVRCFSKDCNSKKHLEYTSLLPSNLCKGISCLKYKEKQNGFIKF